MAEIDTHVGDVVVRNIGTLNARKLVLLDRGMIHLECPNTVTLWIGTGVEAGVQDHQC